ncbi:MAG: DUF4124 domain-containing protein [Myxococcaceae bacterium]|nr:DUF4124 domain-containing protein [Myxococcaceae bacterium]
MRRVVLAACLALGLPAQAQTIYTWTDSRGTVHYTDDPSTIPPKVKATTTEGAELSNTGASPASPEPQAQARAPAPPQAPADPRAEETYWRGQFRTVREKIRTLEDELATDLRRFEDPSRTPGGPNFICPPAFYGPSYFQPGFGFRSGQVVQGGLSASANIPLGNGATLGVQGSAGSVVSQGSTTVGTTGVAPFVGYGYGYGYGGYGGCYLNPSDDYGRMRDRIDRTKASLARAKEELADLERRAANASVPLEWRR